MVLEERINGLTNLRVINMKNTYEHYIEFEEQVYASKGKDVKKDRFAEYYFYTFQGTNGITGRNARGKLLKEYLSSIK